MVQGAQDRHRGEAAHGAERGIGHEFAEVAQDSDVLLRLMAIPQQDAQFYQVIY